MSSGITTLTGNLSVTASPTMFYITPSGVNLTGSMASTAQIAASNLVATSGGLNVTGSSILQSITCTGTVSGSGITN